MAPSHFHVAADLARCTVLAAAVLDDPVDLRLARLGGPDVEVHELIRLSPVPGTGDAQTQRTARVRTKDEVRRVADAQEPPRQTLLGSRRGDVRRPAFGGAHTH